MPEELQGRKARREADLRGALDGKDIDGQSNKKADEKPRRNAIAFIPPKPEDDKQLQTAIELLLDLKKAAAQAQPKS